MGPTIHHISCTSHTIHLRSNLKSSDCCMVFVSMNLRVLCVVTIGCLSLSRTLIFILDFRFHLLLPDVVSFGSVLEINWINTCCFSHLARVFALDIYFFFISSNEFQLKRKIKNENSKLFSLSKNAPSSQDASPASIRN